LRAIDPGAVRITTMGSLSSDAVTGETASDARGAAGGPGR
jgi:hypothetical protein